MNFFLKKLGCPKNDVDADYIIGRLIKSGHILSNEANCSIVIINSCGFILPAKEESIN
jgi:ribosomal protein S12 methylthiotransferase